jgi:phosphoglycolate phosphatase-like HAD superfamily hydrolase
MPSDLTRLDEYTCAVFDCDGVLLDSNPVKIAAFRVALAAEDPERIEAFLADHRRTGGVSRFSKFEHFYQGPAAVEIPAALVRFAEAAREGLRTCPNIPGVEDVLRQIAGHGTPIHVISGGEQAEVREALVGRGWGQLFAGIHGSPTRKHEHLRRLFDIGELVPGGIYFGDAELDMQLAEEFGLSFVFVAGASDWPEGRVHAAARGHVVIEDFAAGYTAYDPGQPGSQ